MIVNNALVNMIHMYIDYGYKPDSTDPLYETFCEWLKTWKGGTNG